MDDWHPPYALGTQTSSPRDTVSTSGTVDVTDRGGRALGLITAVNLDIALSALRDAIVKTGATSKTLADVVAALASIAVTGPLTDTQLRAAGVPVTGTFWQATQPISHTNLSNQIGTWNYVSGSLTSAGTVTGSGKCQEIIVFANGADSTFNVGGGNTITVRTNTEKHLYPKGTVTAPVVNWVSGAIDVIIEGLT